MLEIKQNTIVVEAVVRFQLLSIASSAWCLSLISTHDNDEVRVNYQIKRILTIMKLDS